MGSEVRIHGELGVDDNSAGTADAAGFGGLAAERVDAARVWGETRNPTEHAAVVAAGHAPGRGVYLAGKIPTFAKAGEEWLRDKADRHPATAQGWRVHRRHLVKLDNIRLDRIDVAAVERVRDKLRAKLSAKTISAVLTT
jgi:hypothetical protein